MTRVLDTILTVWGMFASVGIVLVVILAVMALRGDATLTIERKKD
jgi:hypothetical protein